MKIQNQNQVFVFVLCAHMRCKFLFDHYVPAGRPVSLPIALFNTHTHIRIQTLYVVSSSLEAIVHVLFYGLYTFEKFMVIWPFPDRLNHRARVIYNNEYAESTKSVIFICISSHPYIYLYAYARIHMLFCMLAHNCHLHHLLYLLPYSIRRYIIYFFEHNSDATH